MIPSTAGKIKGALFGFAIGDALGHGTEFMSRREVKRRYPDGLKEYSQIINDAHRAFWPKGAWTSETSTLILLVMSIVENEAILPMDVARRLRNWFLEHPTGISSDVRWVLNQESFVTDPVATAERVWAEMGHDNCPNDALGKAIIAGIWNRDYRADSVTLCRLTHPQPRCITSSTVIAKMAHSLMWHNSSAAYEEIVDIARKGCPDTLPYIETARFGNIQDLKLDDPEDFWYVRKAMAAALWAAWHCTSPEEALHKVVAEGGDADTNAALATSLLGLKFGFDSIPEKYIVGLREGHHLMTLSEKFVDKVIKNN